MHKEITHIRRVELSLQTNHAKMDAVTDVAEAIRKAAEWGHTAIAVTDRDAAYAFPQAYQIGKQYGIKVIYGLDGCFINDVDGTQPDRKYRITFLTQNKIGLKNLYKIISYASLCGDGNQPIIPKSMILSHKEGLLIGSGGEEGEVFAALVQDGEAKAAQLAEFYDYLEVRPVPTKLRDRNLQILRLAIALKKPLAAVGNVHYLEKKDKTAYHVLLSIEEKKESRDVSLHFRSDEEMLEEFSYLGDYCYNTVITTPREIAHSCEDVELFDRTVRFPTIENSAEDLMRICQEQLLVLYGEKPAELIRQRLDWELESILRNGFDMQLMLAKKLISRSEENGFSVGIRGCAGASFAAFLLGVTNVNPLPPHYRCLHCRHTVFSDAAECGADLPDAICPTCGVSLAKDGFNIPAETFFGIDGNKQPNIELNFSEKYVERAMEHLKELFGKEYVYRSGASSSITDKEARYHLDVYLDKNGLVWSEEEKQRIVSLLIGVKRYTGPHPGSYFIIPQEKEIFDYCPMKKHQDYTSCITTLFAWPDMCNVLFNQVLLSHTSPTLLHEMEKKTGVSLSDIPLGDPETLSLIRSGDTEGIPEFQSQFAINLIAQTKPSCFSDLVKLYGLMHGAGVWDENAQMLLQAGEATLAQVIANRDDILLYLLKQGIPRKEAYHIMEDVRRGCLKRRDAEKRKNVREMLLRYDIPEWYIASMEKIYYLFPKAHSVSYLLMDFRLAWYKAHYREMYLETMEEVRSK